MNPKEYLQLYKAYGHKISYLEMEYDALNEEIDSIKTKLDGMPKGSNLADKTGELSAQLADTAEELLDARSEAWNMRKHILNTIKEIPNMREQKILYLRYIYGLEWDQIAEEMDLTRQWVNTLHGRGLEAVRYTQNFISFNNCF